LLPRLLLDCGALFDPVYGVAGHLRFSTSRKKGLREFNPAIATDDRPEGAGIVVAAAY
jgi:hypothetical protein